MKRVQNPHQYEISTRFGTVSVRWEESSSEPPRISSVRLPDGKPPGRSLRRDRVPGELVGVVRALEKYFESGVPVGPVPWERIDASAWTPFRRQVYRAVAAIPFGETRTYGQVATRIGAPRSARAIGQAMRSNPIPILVPCHRVTATSTLGGFMGSDDPGRRELSLKRALLSLEGERSRSGSR